MSPTRSYALFENQHVTTLYSIAYMKPLPIRATKHYNETGLIRKSIKLISEGCAHTEV